MSNVLLSVGDVYGPASRSYIMEEMAVLSAIVVKGREQTARPFGQAARVPFPPPLGWRTAYQFPFSDQVFFPETLHAQTVLTRLSLNPAWLGMLLSALARLDLPKLTRGREGAQKRLNRLIGWRPRPLQNHLHVA